MAIAFSAPHLVAAQAADAAQACEEDKTSTAGGQAKAAVKELDAVRVVGHKLETPAPYAGGQVARGSRIGILGDLDYMDTPFSTTAYTAQMIQDTQARTVADVLHNDPSIQPQFPRDSFTDQIQIRGFGQGAEAYFIGGLYGVVPPLTTLAELSERVEVFKGPSALVNGLAPVGGSVNLVSKRAGDVPLTQLTMDYESDSQFGAHVDAARRFGADDAWGARFNGVYRDGDAAVDHQSRRLGLTAAGLDYRGDRARASVDLIGQHQRLDAARSQIYYDFGGPLPQAPDSRTNIEQPWEYETSSARVALARVEADLSRNWTLYAAGGQLRGNEAQLRGIPYTWQPDGTFTDSPFFYRGYTRTASAQAGLQGRFALGATRHELTFDVSQARRRQGYADNYNADPDNPIYPEFQSNLYDPVVVPEPTLVPLPEDLQEYDNTRLSGIALADVVSLFDARVKLILGARQQRVRTTSHDADLRSPTFGQVTSRYDEQALTPGGGVVWRPVSWMSFYGSYIQGLEPGPTAPSDPIYVNANEVFPPVKTAQREGGIKLDLGDFGVALALFRIAQPFGRSVPLDDGRLLFVVDGEQRNQGAELSLFGQPWDRLRVLGGVAYIQAEVTRSEDPSLIGKQAPGAPRLATNIGLEWDVPGAPGLTLTGRAVHKTKQLYYDYMNSIPAWTRFDLGARYRFDARTVPVTLRLNVDNIADRGYWESSGNGLLLASPRTLALSATFDF